MSLMHDALDRDRGGFAAADAQRRDAAFEIPCFERMPIGPAPTIATGCRTTAPSSSAARRAGKIG